MTSDVSCAWPRHASGTSSPRILSQSRYNRRLRRLGPLLGAAALWLATQIPSWSDPLRLMDGTPVRCGASRTTVQRSALAGWAGYGHDASHHAFYWGTKLMLITTPDGTVVAFSLANPKILDERKQALHLTATQQIGPHPCVLIADKGFAGTGIQTATTATGHTLIRPALKTEPGHHDFPGWLRQRIEAIIWTLKNQLGLERHHARHPDSLWANLCQRVLALNTAIWHNWHTGQPVKRSLTAYDH